LFCQNRFNSRSRRWMGLDPHINEALPQELRTLDQMCMSEQMYFLGAFHCGGIMMSVLGMLLVLKQGGGAALEDPLLVVMASAMVAILRIGKVGFLKVATRLKIWEVEGEAEAAANYEYDEGPNSRTVGALPPGMAAIDESIAECVEDCLSAGHTDDTLIRLLSEAVHLPPGTSLMNDGRAAGSAQGGMSISPEQYAALQAQGLLQVAPGAARGGIGAMPGMMPFMAQQGPGAGFQPGMGGAYPPGMGGACPPGMGGAMGGAMGGVYPPGMGGLYPPGMGGAMGGACPPGMGAAYPPGGYGSCAGGVGGGGGGPCFGGGIPGGVGGGSPGGGGFGGFAPGGAGCGPPLPPGVPPPPGLGGGACQWGAGAARGADGEVEFADFMTAFRSEMQRAREADHMKQKFVPSAAIGPTGAEAARREDLAARQRADEIFGTMLATVPGDNEESEEEDYDEWPDELLVLGLAVDPAEDRTSTTSSTTSPTPSSHTTSPTESTGSENDWPLELLS